MAALCSNCRKLLSSLSRRAVARKVAARYPVEVLRCASYSILPDSLSAITEKRKDYSEERVLGYTPEEVYAVVADVSNYQNFLPWCHASSYLREGTRKTASGFRKGIAKLAIGFPPLVESYTALVIVDPPNSLRNISTDGRLFSHLENLWHFRKGPELETGPTCTINFWVRFEFRSLVYARLGFLFFDEVARTMASSFERRCEQLYGPSHIKGGLQRREGGLQSHQRREGEQLPPRTEQGAAGRVVAPSRLGHHIDDV